MRYRSPKLAVGTSAKIKLNQYRKFLNQPEILWLISTGTKPRVDEHDMLVGR